MDDKNLSELIKECGDGFLQLSNTGRGFFAIAGGKKMNIGITALYKTPEEAVTELLLKLNK